MSAKQVLALLAALFVGLLVGGAGGAYAALHYPEQLELGLQTLKSVNPIKTQ